MFLILKGMWMYHYLKLLLKIEQNNKAQYMNAIKFFCFHYSFLNLALVHYTAKFPLIGVM